MLALLLAAAVPATAAEQAVIFRAAGFSRNGGVSKQAAGTWKRIYDETAMPEFLATKGAGGWPDILLGGPGFCFPIYRWNGKAYALNRFEYDGKRCKPSR